MTRLAPLWQQAGSYPANTDRVLLATLWPSAGSTGGAASVVSNTMTVSVAAGTAAVPLGSAGANYTALCRWDAAEVVTHTAAPPSGQSRIDVGVLQVRDNALDAGGNNDFIFQAIAGAPTTGTPAAPAVPANAYAVYQITVPGAAANLNGVTITDRRSGLAVVTAGNVYARIWRSAAFTATASAIIPFDTVQYDPSGMVSAGTIRVPVAGSYQVCAGAAVSGLAANAAAWGWVRQNTGWNLQLRGTADATGYNFVRASDIIRYNAGDTCDLYWGGPASAAGVTGTDSTFLSVQYLHP